MKKTMNPNVSRVSRKSNRFSTLRARLFICLVSTSISLVVAIIAEKQIRRFNSSRYPDFGNYVQPDDSREGGYFVPNLDILAKGEFDSQPIRLITNSEGFRNAAEFSHEVPDKCYRVLFMGDSYVAGFRTDQKEMIGYKVEQYLATKSDSKFEEHEVMVSCENNPSVCWYRYQEHGYKYNPDLVIVGVTIGNDISPRDYKKKLFPVSKAVGEGIPRLTKSEELPAQRNEELLLPPEAFRKKTMGDLTLGIELQGRRSLARRFSNWGYAVPPAIGNPGPNKQYHVHAGGNLTSLGLFYSPLLPEVEDWFTEFQEVITGMKQQVEFNGSEFKIVLFPTRFQVDDRDWNAMTRFYCLDESKFDLDYPNRRILEMCRQNQISCLDLTPRFRDIIRDSGDRLFMVRGDMHFNSDGQALAAHEIGECIRSERHISLANNADNVNQAVKDDTTRR